MTRSRLVQMPMPLKARVRYVSMIEEARTGHVNFASLFAFTVSVEFILAL